MTVIAQYINQIWIPRRWQLVEIEDKQVSNFEMLEDK